MEKLFVSPDDDRRYRAAGIWGDLTLYERFARQAANAPGKLAVIVGQDRYTYGRLSKLIDNLASHFLRLGIGHGEVVAVQVPNGVELPLAHLALNRIGALCMPIHDSWREAEVGHVLRQGRAVAAVVPASYRGFDYPAMVAGLRGTLPELRQVFSIGGVGEQSSAFEALLEDVALDARALEARRPDPDEPGALMLSSGTTSMPKISVFSSNNIFALVHAFARAIRLVPDDIAAAWAPAGTGAIGYCFPIMAPLLHGGTTAILERWDPADGIALITGHRCTYGTAVPAQLAQAVPLLEAHAPAEFAGLRCFNNAGAPLPAGTARQVEARMNCVVVSMYGATDGGSLSATDLEDPDSKRIGTVGKPFEGRELKLMNADGSQAGPGEPGEIHFRSADKSYGYLNEEEATRATFTPDGFYRSGDLGRLDEDGYLQIIGRVKDMILRGGRNLSPRLIEEALMEHPSIIEVAVAAMPDPVLGERACAFVILKEGCRLDFEQAIAFLKERKVSVWQLPERLEVMDDLPRSAGGKVAKNQLTQLITDKLAYEN